GRGGRQVGGLGERRVCCAARGRGGRRRVRRRGGLGTRHRLGGERVGDVSLDTARRRRPACGALGGRLRGRRHDRRRRWELAQRRRQRHVVRIVGGRRRPQREREMNGERDRERRREAAREPPG